MCNAEVTVDDVVEAIFVMEYSFRGCGIFSDRFNLCQIQFPENSEASFEIRKAAILGALQP